MVDRTRRATFVLAVSVLTAASVSAAHADNTRLHIYGSISPGLKPDLTITLNSSSPLCWGNTKIVEAHTDIQDGKYEITAGWDPGVCGFNKGFASLTVNGRTDQRAKLDSLFESSGTGYVEFHEVSSLRCENDPDFNQFSCTPIRADASSIIGSNFYFDPSRTGRDYHLDFLAD